MATLMTDAHVLRATLCEIERGLYYVTYNWDGIGPGTHSLPRYQVGPSVAEAKRRIEHSAHGCGFAVVLWESEVATPGVLTSPATEALPPGD